MSSKKTICLTMIVKNEGHLIADTLEHLLKYIKFDYWVISDTGSTDKTKEIITNFFKAKNIPGELLEHPWQDFGYNRTKAFEGAYKKADYAFVWDADDEIYGDFKMPEVLDGDSYKFVFGNDDGLRYSRCQLFNNHQKWCYKGVLHEYANCLEPSKPSIDVLGNYYFISGRRGDRSKDPNKYLKDALVLEKAIVKAKEENDPLHNRYVFYCAQSYNSCNMHEKAIEFYKQALTIDLWTQEKYMACLEIYDQYEKLGRPEEGVRFLVESYKYDRDRVECFYRLVKHYCINGPVEAAYMYYTLIQDFYENRYPSINLADKLFAKKCEYDFYLPYYMVIVAERTRHLDTSAKMFQIIFKNKYIANEWWIRNLFHNIQFTIENLPKDINFLNDMLSYIDLLKIKGVTLEQRHNEIIDRIITAYRPLLIVENPLSKNIEQNALMKKNVRVMLTVTTCKRLDLYEKTINSILNCWTDVDKIDYFYCVDDNSSKEDRAKMQELYPFFNYYFKSPNEKGHRESMNLIWLKLQEIKPTYWVHLEDDWLYFKKEAYVTKAIHALEKYETQNIHQVVFNRDYGLMYTDLERVGGILLEPGLILHEKRDGLQGKNCGYWPHYSLQPSLSRVSKILELGNYDSPNKFFERDYADKYFAKGYMTAFFNSIYSIHIGKQHWEKDGKNAYALNEIPQFGVVAAGTNTETTVEITEVFSKVNEPLPVDGTMKEHLDVILGKIKNSVPFGLIRPSDGERAVMLGETLTNCDNWTFTKGDKLQQQLLDAVQTVDPNLYIGIPCNTCNKPWNCTRAIYKNFTDDFKIPLAQRTYANLFMNSNWQTFADFLKSYSKGFFLITSGTSATDLPLKERFVIDSKLVNTWNVDGAAETERLMKFIRNKKGELICFSAGPLSKVWIPMCMKENPTNMYLDVGAAIDIFTKGKTNRFYTNAGHPFSKETCRFDDRVGVTDTLAAISGYTVNTEYTGPVTKKFLTYMCVFHNKDYMELLKILLISLKLYSKTDAIDFLILTSEDFKPLVDDLSKLLDIPLKTMTFNFKTMHEATCARLFIFDYPQIELYEKVLYLDTDIVVQNDLTVLFEQPIEDRVYAMKEGTIEHEYHGGWFFDFSTVDKNITGMNSGILLFKPSEAIKQIFSDIVEQVKSMRKANQNMPSCLDQPFINYHCVKNDRHQTGFLEKYGLIYCYDPPPPPSAPTDVILCHFVWPVGNALHKRDRMIKHLTHILNNYQALKGTNISPFVGPDLSDNLYSWGERGAIKFLKNGVLDTSWVMGNYKWLDANTVEANWAGCYHTLRMNADYTEFISIRKGDIAIGKSFIDTNLYDYVPSDVLIDNSSPPAIILTSTVFIGKKEILAQVDPNERKQIYIKSIRQWLNNTKFNIVVVENSGYTFDELSEELNTYKGRFEIITFNETTLDASKHLVDDTNKGTSELFSINYAYRHSTILPSSNFIIKITGRYYIPELEEYLKGYNLDLYDGIRQFDTSDRTKSRCEMIGSHSKNFSKIFKRARSGAHSLCVEKDYYDRFLEFKNVLVCKEFQIEPTIAGSRGNIVRNL